MRQLQKRLAERILAGELTEHLGYAPGTEKPAEQGNHRDGTSAKTVLTESGALPLAIPQQDYYQEKTVDQAIGASAPGI